MRTHLHMHIKLRMFRKYVMQGTLKLNFSNLMISD